MVQDIEVISTLMQETYGLDISVFGEAFLMRTIEQRLKATGMAETKTYLAYLNDHPSESQSLSVALMVNYSRFFRELNTFSLLETIVLPNIVEEKADTGELRIWSAGCSRGQEAYSIAILLNELAEDSGRMIRFRIFATDISEILLDNAATGVYEFDAVQNIRLKHLEKFFTKVNNKYNLSNKIKQNVHFSVFDILSQENVHPPESIYGDFDLVICCNLLIYYKPEYQQAILNRLRQSLAPKGYLVIGEAERLLVEPGEGIQSVSFTAPIFRNKLRRKIQCE